LGLPRVKQLRSKKHSNPGITHSSGPPARVNSCFQFKKVWPDCQEHHKQIDHIQLVEICSQPLHTHRIQPQTGQVLPGKEAKQDCGESVRPKTPPPNSQKPKTHRSPISKTYDWLHWPPKMDNLTC
jgi:hypothetical protein